MEQIEQTEFYRKFNEGDLAYTREGDFGVIDYVMWLGGFCYKVGDHWMGEEDLLTLEEWMRIKTQLDELPF